MRLCQQRLLSRLIVGLQLLHFSVKQFNTFNPEHNFSCRKVSMGLVLICLNSTQTELSDILICDSDSPNIPIEIYSSHHATIKTNFSLIMVKVSNLSILLIYIISS